MIDDMVRAEVDRRKNECERIKAELRRLIRSGRAAVTETEKDALARKVNAKMTEFVEAVKRFKNAVAEASRGTHQNSSAKHR